ncbi:hypothetical protein [Desulfobacter curvatus]|uniref:hypothetical protein n=1 Tax=Desulfobacter curvatus TaxID=2290 RepID=UPI00037B7FE7|nr:hypothetical protein [Desulfobacter curvatus]
MDLDTLYQVNRLVYLSLAHSHGRKSLVIRHQQELGNLIQRYQADAGFQRAVAQALKAMDLSVLALEDDGFCLSSIGAESLFSMTVTDYGKLLGRGDFRAADILCVHAAVATAFFPQEQDLELPVEDLGAVTQADIFEILRRFAKLCPEDKDGGSESHDNEACTDDTVADRLHPQIITLAQRIREMPEDNPDIRQTGGAAGNSWRELIEQVMRHMRETRYILAFEEHDGVVEYRPTAAYQAAVREGMLYTFQAFRDIVSRGKEEAGTQEDDHV